MTSPCSLCTRTSFTRRVIFWLTRIVFPRPRRGAASDLARVVDDVVSSLREADEVVQSAMAAVATSRGGLTDSVRVDLTDRLEARARDIEESIKGQSGPSRVQT